MDTEILRKNINHPGPPQIDPLTGRAILADVTPPAAPTESVSKNAAGYVYGNTPLLAGIAEAGSIINVFSGATRIGSTVTKPDGFWSLNSIALADGSYTVRATATDAAGNTSAWSSPLSFNVDAHAPVAPTVVSSLAANGNQPAFSGSGEAGTDIYLVDGARTVIGRTKVDAAGHWSINPHPLANGSYSITVQSADIADNITEAASKVNLAISSTLNVGGTAGNDILRGTSGNNAISGQGGIDTAVYAGARAGYTVRSGSGGFSVTSGADGFDWLAGMERIRFGDSALAIDIDGHGGQAYRIYQAAFDRAPDQVGVGYWMDRLDAGASRTAVARGFVDSQEFANMYGVNPTNLTFVTKLYAHVLHRNPDGPGFDYWMNVLGQGADRAEVLAAFSESPENILQVVGTIGNGFEYVPWAGG
ncbi:MAG: DUF4214 domain-containing protein [Pseudomonadota bacterium]